MRLFLIRHGESVDNVATLYAGSRDSELTNHGYQQASRLGSFLQSSGVSLTHIFSSHLKRAVRTAELIRDAQSTNADEHGNNATLVVKQVPQLTEQDFGSLEGISFISRPTGSTKSGKEAHHELHKDDPSFIDVESKDSMSLRADQFLDDYLVPLFETRTCGQMPVIAIVSHGILLSVLWRRLLRRLPPTSVTFQSDLLAIYGGMDLERLNGWSNTGYLELEMRYEKASSPRSDNQSSQTPINPAAKIVNMPNQADTPSQPGTSDNSQSTPELTISSNATTPITNILHGWKTTIHNVNNKRHLNGLKRTGGGVGSAAHDSTQKSIKTFFKRRKVD